MHCEQPLYLQMKDGTYKNVPCGVCRGCLIEQSQRYTLLVNNILKNNKYSIFFTLTYDNEHIPYVHPSSPYVIFNVGLDEFGYPKDFYLNPYQKMDELPNHPITNFLDSSCVGVLFRPHIKELINKLRNEFKKLNYDSPSFFIIGEYGSSLYRPHYHGIISTQALEQTDFAKKILPSLWKYCPSDVTEAWCKYVDGNNFSYLSSYINGRYYLDSFYRNILFKPFSFYSFRKISKFDAVDLARMRESVITGNIPNFIRFDNSKKDNSNVLLVSKNLLYQFFPGLPKEYQGNDVIKYGIARNMFEDFKHEFETYRRKCFAFLKYYGLSDNVFNRDFYVLISDWLHNKYASDQYKHWVYKLPKIHDYISLKEYLLNYTDTFQMLDKSINFGSDSYEGFRFTIYNFLKSCSLDFHVDLDDLCSDLLREKFPSRYYGQVDHFIRKNNYVLKVKHYNSVKQKI